MVVYKGKSYSSKADVVRDLFESGEITSTPADKNRISRELDIRVQTVHAVITRLLVEKKIIKVTPKVSSVSKVPYCSSNEGLKSKIMERFAECYQISNDFRSDNEDIIDMPEVRFDLNSRTTAAMYCYNKGKSYFRINLFFAKNNIEDYIGNTIPHEVCHHLVFERITRPFRIRVNPHGREWSYFMRNIFKLEPKTYHNYKLPDSIKYRCNCQEIYLSPIRHNKMMKDPTYYTCKKCHSYLKLAQ
jgi:predicted SprT family Zn-dependent metalloprotease